ncbi:MAG: phosphate ABC transporter permease PstA [Planctomycetota bacterium]|nr:MAG: phosphate ABC transporter permease PstA [Planctomycetota bacterium]
MEAARVTPVEAAQRAVASAVAPAAPASGAGAQPPHRRGRRTALAAAGEPLVWLLGAGQVLAVLMIAGLLGLIFYQGFRTFWPRPLVQMQVRTAPDAPPQRYLGEVVRHESYRLTGTAPDGAVPAAERRSLLRVGNYDFYGDDFRWIPELGVVAELRPADAVTIERLEWGPFFGFVREYRVDGRTVATGEAAWRRFQAEHGGARGQWARARRMLKHDLGRVNRKLEEDRLALRRVELAHGRDSAEYADAVRESAAGSARLQEEYRRIQSQAEALRQEAERTSLVVAEVGGREKELKSAEIVRAFQPNALGFTGKLGVYFSRWWEFLSAEPREANTEGGVLPAIFGTVAMTLIMALLVTPFGVIAALYLREYARQGWLVSVVRIAVNNLAGVPSIVFGVFGLGFFCYVIGASMDQLFFAEKLPNPTFGTGGLMWASLTLALLTVPVVIVATEEALAAVPRSLREGAFACGASKWQVIRRVVLPKALPGIMTGVVLAMARGAGEVAPLMITGVVKLAPELPLDGEFPFLHLNRSFMHLGFHIYDVGFQSRNAEAGKPMVFTTTLLLICVVLLLNISVIAVRTRLKRKYESGYF